MPEFLKFSLFVFAPSLRSRANRSDKLNITFVKDPNLYHKNDIEENKDAILVWFNKSYLLLLSHFVEEGLLRRRGIDKLPSSTNEGGDKETKIVYLCL